MFADVFCRHHGDMLGVIIDTAEKKEHGGVIDSTGGIKLNTVIYAMDGLQRGMMQSPAVMLKPLSKRLLIC
jgi:hypothetical protein